MIIVAVAVKNITIAVEMSKINVAFSVLAPAPLS
jgi:hypothetical protein